MPVAVVEGNCAGWEEVPGLLECAGSSIAEVEVLRRIIRMPEVEAPIEVEE